MVRLLGVHHGEYRSLLGINFGDFSVHPSVQTLNLLSTLPKGTRIGIEDLPPEQWQEVKQDLEGLCWSVIGAENFERFPSYADESRSYFTELDKICREDLGLGIVYLEDKDTWLRYNRAIARTAWVNARIHERILFKEKGESDADYTKKLFRCNEAGNGANLKARKIHEIDRDTKLLEKIARTGVQVAVVGQRHGNLWFSRRETIQEAYNLQFNSYSTDLASESSSMTRGVFTENASPNPKLLFEEEGLIRALRLLKTGRITTTQTPDFVGVWDYSEPSKGYFEVFIDKQDGFSGTIKDLNGDATFSGRLDKQEVFFIKIYQRGGLNYAEGDIVYKALRQGNEFIGYYFIQGSSTLFYMTTQQAKPIDLAMRREELFKANKDKLKELSRKHFAETKPQNL